MNIHSIIDNISIAIGTISSAIIIWGVAIAIFRFVRVEAGKAGMPDERIEHRKKIRHELGSYLILGLEVLIAADVIETIVNPSINEMVILASIVFIRTFIGYFLEREFKQE